MNLDDRDRLILALLLKLLEHLEGESTVNKEVRTVIEEGLEVFYDDAAKHFISTPIPPDVSREVFSILDLYRSLITSADLLQDAGEDCPRVEFPGFDGNSEYQHLRFASLLLEEMHRYQEIAEHLEEDDLNSHRPMLESYRAMLQRWTAMGRPTKLSRDEIKQLIA